MIFCGSLPTAQSCFNRTTMIFTQSKSKVPSAVAPDTRAWKRIRNWCKDALRLFGKDFQKKRFWGISCVVECPEP